MAPARSSSSRAYARRSAATNLPRNTRLRTFTGKKKLADFGRIQAGDPGRSPRPARRSARADVGPGSGPRYGGCSEIRSLRRDAAGRPRPRAVSPHWPGTAGCRRAPVAMTQRHECVREREHDVHVPDLQQLALPRGQPALARLRLTLGTVPIPTRIVRDGPMSASAAVIDVPAERGGPTARDSAQHGALLHAEPRMSFDESVTLGVEDIGHLHGGPTHDPVGFRFKRDRSTTTGWGTWSCSRGFGAAGGAGGRGRYRSCARDRRGRGAAESCASQPCAYQKRRKHCVN